MIIFTTPDFNCPTKYPKDISCKYAVVLEQIYWLPTPAIRIFTFGDKISNNHLIIYQSDDIKDVKDYKRKYEKQFNCPNI